MKTYNREIEFRGKAIDKKNNSFWIFGSLHICKSGVYRIYPFNGGSYEVDKNTVGQYTGLKDKNHKKIYEGDIIIQDFKLCEKNSNINVVIGTYKGVVRITSRGISINPCFITYEKEDKKRITKYKTVIGNRSEIIGNVYDNPKILK